MHRPPSPPQAAASGGASPHIALPPGRIDLWCVPLAGFGADEQAACLALLSETEQARHRRFAVEPARLQYLATRGLVRTTLSRYAPRPPQDWRFDTNPFGRPLIEAGQCDGRLFFSLSHTGGLAVCAVAATPEIGVDVERWDRAADPLALAPSVLAPEETTRLIEARPEERARLFLTAWTLKEAYVKARGMGLALPLRGVRFDIDAGDPKAHFAAGIADDPGRWTFRMLAPTAEHALALAVAAAPDHGLDIRMKATRAINRPDDA